MTSSEPDAVLVVCADAPFPPTSGTPLRTWQTISIAARTRRVGVLSIGSRDAGVEALPGVERWRHIDLSEAAEARPAFGFPLLADADALVAMESAFDELDAALHPRVVVFSNIWPSRLPKTVKTNERRVILDLHNAYADYARQSGRDPEPVAAIESRAAREVDAVWACSDEDARSLRLSCGATPIVVIPNGVDVAAYAGIRDGSTAASARKALTLLFVASFWYEPNRAAAEMLIAKILPEVRAAIPRARLVLVGAAPSAAMLEAAKADRGVVVTGRLPDVRPYLELADIVVAPLTHGTGTRLKLLEAFAARRAVVATTKAAEGLAVADGTELILCEPERFARALIELSEAPERRLALAANAYRRVVESYGWDALAPKVLQALLPPR